MTRNGFTFPGNHFTGGSIDIAYMKNQIGMAGSYFGMTENHFKTSGSIFTAAKVQLTFSGNRCTRAVNQFTNVRRLFTCAKNVFTFPENQLAQSKINEPGPGSYAIRIKCQYAMPSGHVEEVGIGFTVIKNDFTYPENDFTYPENDLTYPGSDHTYPAVDHKILNKIYAHDTSLFEFNPLPVCRLYLQRYLSVIYQSMRMDCILTQNNRCHE